jgi:hypothetical protein
VNLPASPPRAPGCVSDLELDELLAGDLAGLRREATLRAHIDGCARCRERLAAFSAVEPPPAATMLPQVMRASATRRLTRWRLAAAVMTMGAAAAVFAVVLRPRGEPGAGPEERTKGSLALALFVKRPSGTVETVTGAGTLHPGDEMRFAVAAARPGYAVVLGLDAAPSVTLYAPYAAAGAPAQAIRLDHPGTTTLPGSIVADATAGAERVVAVVCEAAPPLEALRARALAVLTAASGDPARVASLGSGCLESSVLLRKEPRPR